MLSFRFLRIPIAIAFLVLCAAALLQQRNTLEVTERSLIFEVSMKAREVSELVAEAQSFYTALVRYDVADAPLELAQQEFEVFWSRWDNVKRVPFDETSALARAIGELDSYMQRADTILFAPTAPTPEQSARLREDLRPILINIRQTWTQEFRNQGPEVWVSDDAEVVRERRLVELLITAVVVLSVAYLAVEGVVARRAAQREADLRHAADAANRAKSDFIAKVSHEIRTPLNGIMGMVSVLSEKNLPADQKLCVDVIEQSGDLLLCTINDVLDIARVETGNIVLQEEDFDPNDALRASQNLYARLAEEKNLDLTLSMGQLPLMHGDARRIKQVVNNLLANAIKFTDKGVVAMVAKYSDGVLRIVVRDSGVGIAEDQQELVFEPFGQVEGGKTQGTGLGLPISREICRVMGGDLTVRSAPGQGAEFVVEIPIKTRDVPLAASPTIPPITPAKPAPTPMIRQESTLEVLLVDDNEINLIVLERLLESAAVRCQRANSGEEALVLNEAFTFDLILMDARMPGLDGATTTERILARATETGRPAPRIVGVTANVLPEQTDRYIEAGMEGVVPKPIPKSVLMTVIADVQAKRPLTAIPDALVRSSW